MYYANWYICIVLQVYSCMCVYIWVSMCCCVWGFPELWWQCQFSCSCGWLWWNYPGPCWFCVFSCTVPTFMYLCVWLHVCNQYNHLVVCWLSRHTAHLGKWLKNALSYKVLNWITCVSLCSQLAVPLQCFVWALITMALYLMIIVVTSAKPDPSSSGCLLDVYFHRRVASSRPSFQLLPPFIVCSIDMQRLVGWDGDQDIKKYMCEHVCIHTYRICV